MTAHPAQPFTEHELDVPAMLAEQIDTLESIRMTPEKEQADTRVPGQPVSVGRPTAMGAPADSYDAKNLGAVRVTWPCVHTQPVDASHPEAGCLRCWGKP